MNQNYTTTFTVDQSPQDVFAAVTNVRGWWSEEIEGGTEKLNDEFDYHFQDIHRCKMRLTEVVPGKKVVWLVLENYFNFIQDQSEWVNTQVVFEIVEKGGKTELQFAHLGLVPAYECFEICSNAWGTYINGSLRDLITTGKGQPNAKDRPTTETEKEMLESRT
ncbi:MAG: SRPBCC domain-containing protein [Anaerolineae bacterium]|nr:SRPBCC domain-containing protein [Anaerolineae bacterium]